MKISPDSPQDQRPLCFVLMPFGTKKDPGGGPDIDFDRIYEAAIRPAIEAAGMEPLRADEERTGGIIHRAMFERLLLCDYAVADLTGANANVFYELGIRHATRPATTLAIFGNQHKPPFDVNYLRSLPYDLGEMNRFGTAEAARLQTQLAQRLGERRVVAIEDAATDSPLFQLLTDFKPPDIARLKTDVFRDQVRYAARTKSELATARSSRDLPALKAIESSLGPLDGVEAGVLVDLFLSYRALQSWDQMIALHDRLPAVLRRAILVREQLAFALNRSGRWEEALRILEEVAREQGPSSETQGLIGRIYKDRWVGARAAGDNPRASGFLSRAIDAYVKGFEADWRDAYPGINAVTLLDIQGTEPALTRKEELLPVVRYAVKRRIQGSRPDYWDYATQLELAVLANDEAATSEALSWATSAIREAWEPLTTANNLRLIQEARKERGVAESWLEQVIAALDPST